MKLTLFTTDSTLALFLQLLFMAEHLSLLATITMVAVAMETPSSIKGVLLWQNI